MKQLSFYGIIFCSLLLVQCHPLQPLKQGFYANKGVPQQQTVDCVFSPMPVYSTRDFLLFHCASEPKDYYYVPVRLTIENDLNSNPLVFSQWLKKNKVNLLVKFSYEKQPYIDAYHYVKARDAANNLKLLPVHSVSITPLTALPDIHINYSATTTYAFYEGYVGFGLKGKTAINSMRSLLIGSPGFQMNYQFSFLTSQEGKLVEQSLYSSIQIGNINF